MQVNESELLPSIQVREEVDSTMLEVEYLLEQNNISNFGGVMAYRQNQGRGRLQRVWKTGYGENLAVSFWIEIELKYLAPLPLVVGLAVIDCLDAQGLKGRTRCKWPNDVYVDQKKICGILCQYGNSHKSTGSIAGIGINLGLKEEDLKNIDQPATSVFIATGNKPDPYDICKELQKCLAQRVMRLHREGFVGLAEDWYSLCAHAGKEVEIDTTFEKIIGTTVGVNSRGELLVNCSGEIKNILCGDVHLRVI